MAGKHGGNVQVIVAPDGWPIWTSGVRPGPEHDTTALRAHPEGLPLLAEWTDELHAVLRQVAGGVLVHQRESVQNNAFVVRGRAGVLLIDPGTRATNWPA